MVHENDVEPVEWEKCRMHRKNNVNLSFTRQNSAVGLRDTGLVQSKRRLKGVSWDTECLKRSCLVLVPKQERRDMMIQTPSHSRSTFREMNRELLIQSQSLHGNCSVSLMTLT